MPLRFCIRYVFELRVYALGFSFVIPDTSETHPGKTTNRAGTLVWVCDIRSASGGQTIAVNQEATRTEQGNTGPAQQHEHTITYRHPANRIRKQKLAGSMQGSRTFCWRFPVCLSNGLADLGRDMVCKCVYLIFCSGRCTVIVAILFTVEYPLHACYPMPSTPNPPKMLDRQPGPYAIKIAAPMVTFTEK